MSIGRQDYYAPGDYNAICDRCGGKFKASQLRKDWQGFMLCEGDWEPRHPQEYVRARTGPEPAPVGFTRAPTADTFRGVCSVAGQSSLPDAATGDCWLADFYHPSFDPDVEEEL